MTYTHSSYYLPSYHYSSYSLIDSTSLISTPSSYHPHTTPTHPPSLIPHPHHHHYLISTCTPHYHYIPSVHVLIIPSSLHPLHMTCTPSISACAPLHVPGMHHTMHVPLIVPGMHHCLYSVSMYLMTCTIPTPSVHVPATTPSPRHHLSCI